MKPRYWLLIVCLITATVSTAHAALEDKLSSSDARKREKALKKLEALDIREKMELIEPLGTKYNQLRDSPTDEAKAIRDDLLRALTAIGSDVLNDSEDKSYSTYIAMCKMLGSAGEAAAPSVPALIKMLRYEGHQGVSPLTVQDDGVPPEAVYIAAKRALIQIGAPAVPHLIRDVEREYPDLSKGEVDLQLDHTSGQRNRMEPLWILGEIKTDEAQSFYKRFEGALFKKNTARKEAEQKQKQDAAKSIEEDFAKTRKDALNGNATAQNNLGIMYYKGNGVAQDSKQAFTWIAKAAAQGDTVATENLYALLRDEIKTALLAEDVKWGRQPLPYMMPIPAVLGKLYARENPLWVFVDEGWEFSSAYTKREYVLKLLAIVKRYPLKIDAITIRRLERDTSARELTYTEAPWTRVVFGDTLKTLAAESIAPKLPPGLKPEAPQEGALNSR
jgi:hypothetical protein